MSTLPIVLGRGAGLRTDLRRDDCTYILGLHYRLFHYPDERRDGQQSWSSCWSYHGGLHRAGNRHFDALPLPREFAAAVVVDLDSAADAQRCLLSPRRHSRLAVQPRAAIPEQPRRKRLYPHPDAWERTLSEVLCRNQDGSVILTALVYGGLACIGIHLGAQPRGQGRHPGAAELRIGRATATPKHPQEPPRPVRKKATAFGTAHGTRTTRNVRLPRLSQTKTSGIAT